MTKREALRVAQYHTMGCWWGSPLNGLPSGKLVAIGGMMAELRGLIGGERTRGRFMGWPKSATSRLRAEAYDMLATAYDIERLNAEGMGLRDLVLRAVGQGTRGKNPNAITAEVLAVDPGANTEDIWNVLKALRDSGLVEEREVNREYGFGYLTYRIVGAKRGEVV